MTGRSQDGQDRQRRRSRVWRAWADLPMREGLVVIVIPLLAMLLATVLFGVALAQGRRAQGAVLHTVEVEREQALREAQAMLEHIVAWSPMVMFRGLLGGSGERFVSGNIQRLLGYTPTRS